MVVGANRDLQFIYNEKSMLVLIVEANMMEVDAIAVPLLPLHVTAMHALTLAPENNFAHPLGIIIDLPF